MKMVEGKMKKVSGNIVDVVNDIIYPGTLMIQKGKIVDITKENRKYNKFIIPPLIDAHVHIESSMLVPTEFARLAVCHGTVASVSDPHEIANVLGIDGINFMVENGKQSPFKFYFGAPSCVPATSFESTGHRIDANNVTSLLYREEIKYLSEMMNFPGVIHRDPEVIKKIETAIRLGLPIDGHAPGLSGQKLAAYVNAGISTDHETIDKEEALEKLELGMKILIREGSAAKNFDALVCFIEKYPEKCMLCSDDKHPDDLVQGHINQLVKRALDAGCDKMKVFKTASINTIMHYGLEVGLLQKADFADFVVIDGFESFRILETWIDGSKVAENGKTLLPCISINPINNFNTTEKKIQDFAVPAEGKKINLIQALDGQIYTEWKQEYPKIQGNNVVSDPDRDILKISVVNRYVDVQPAVAFINNFGLKKGAIAASIAHDSHNIVAVGSNDDDLTKAINLIIRNKGGLSIVHGKDEFLLPLPVGGLMANDDCFTVSRDYSIMDRKAKAFGSLLQAPFMTLSFMALLVIPKLKLSDKGLFNSETFEFTNLFV